MMHASVVFTMADHMMQVHNGVRITETSLSGIVVLRENVITEHHLSGEPPIVITVLAVLGKKKRKRHLTN
jgi:hypothetical protein